jgi:hypothetical protein
MKTEDRRLRIEDGRGGRDEGPMYTGRSEAGENVQGPKSKVHPVRNAERGLRNIEYFRLKTDFRSRDGERWRRVSSFWARIPGKAPSPRHRMSGAQSMTMRAILKPGRDLARVGGNCSLRA